MSNVKVAIRVRPMTKREEDSGAENVITTQSNTVVIRDLRVDGDNDYGDSRERHKRFTFDYVFESIEGTPNYSSQEQIFQDLGVEVLSGTFKGYNNCVFAYGMTGTGKTFTMMGYDNEAGLIPRIVEGLFSNIEEIISERTTSRVEVSYVEIYNERVRDLLRPTRQTEYSLKVREHPKEGPYVKDLSRHRVTTNEAVQDLINRGNEFRATAATHMHDLSSRSHAIFTIRFSQAIFDDDFPQEIESKIHLVDLAGSERADAHSAIYTAMRLKEGSNINKSLVTLGNVIKALAENSVISWSQQRDSLFSPPLDRDSPFPKKRQAHIHIPYRDSVLTWLLKDSLGGNSKTFMIATVSPANIYYKETINTLRYAQRAKNIVNKPLVNEDPQAKLIRDLKGEIDRLKGLLESSTRGMTPISFGVSGSKIMEQLKESETRAHQLTVDWMGKWQAGQNIMIENDMTVRRPIGKSGSLGLVLESQLPHLIGMDEDILNTGIFIYNLKMGVTKIGRDDAETAQDIVLSGNGIEKEHCVIKFEDDEVTLYPLRNAVVLVGNQEVTRPCVKLRQGDVVQFGRNAFFRFNNPAEAARLREQRSIEEKLYRSSSDLSLYRDDLSPDVMSQRTSPSLHSRSPAPMLITPRLDYENRYTSEIERLSNAKRELDNIRREKEKAEEDEKEREELLFRQYEEHRSAIEEKQSHVQQRLVTIKEEIISLEVARAEEHNRYEIEIKQSATLLEKEKKELDEEEISNVDLSVNVDDVASLKDDPEKASAMTNSYLRERRRSLSGRRKSLVQLELKHKFDENAIRNHYERQLKAMDEKIKDLQTSGEVEQKKLEETLQFFREKDMTLLKELETERENVAVLTRKVSVLHSYVEEKEREFLDKRMAEIDDEEAIIAGKKPRKRRSSRVGLSANERIKSDEDLMMSLQEEAEEDGTVKGANASTSTVAAMFDMPIFAKRKYGCSSMSDERPIATFLKSRPKENVKSVSIGRTSDGYGSTSSLTSVRSTTSTTSVHSRQSLKAEEVTNRLYKTPKQAGIYSRVKRAERAERIRDSTTESKRKLERRNQGSGPSKLSKTDRSSPKSGDIFVTVTSPSPKGMSPVESPGRGSPIVEKSSTIVQLRRGGTRTVEISRQSGKVLGGKVMGPSPPPSIKPRSPSPKMAGVKSHFRAGSASLMSVPEAIEEEMACSGCSTDHSASLSDLKRYSMPSAGSPQKEDISRSGSSQGSDVRRHSEPNAEDKFAMIQELVDSRIIESDASIGRCRLEEVMERSRESDAMEHELPPRSELKRRRSDTDFGGTKQYGQVIQGVTESDEDDFTPIYKKILKTYSTENISLPAAKSFEAFGTPILDVKVCIPGHGQDQESDSLEEKENEDGWGSRMTDRRSSMPEARAIKAMRSTNLNERFRIPSHSQSSTASSASQLKAVGKRRRPRVAKPPESGQIPKPRPLGITEIDPAALQYIQTQKAPRPSSTEFEISFDPPSEENLSEDSLESETIASSRQSDTVTPAPDHPVFDHPDDAINRFFIAYEDQVIVKAAPYHMSTPSLYQPIYQQERETQMEDKQLRGATGVSLPRRASEGGELMLEDSLDRTSNFSYDEFEMTDSLEVPRARIKKMSTSPEETPELEDSLEMEAASSLHRSSIQQGTQTDTASEQKMPIVRLENTLRHLLDSIGPQKEKPLRRTSRKKLKQEEASTGSENSIHPGSKSQRANTARQPMRRRKRGEACISGDRRQKRYKTNSDENRQSSSDFTTDILSSDSLGQDEGDHNSPDETACEYAIKPQATGTPSSKRVLSGRRVMSTPSGDGTQETDFPVSHRTTSMPDVIHSLKTPTRSYESEKRRLRESIWPDNVIYGDDVRRPYSSSNSREYLDERDDDEYDDDDDDDDGDYFDKDDDDDAEFENKSHFVQKLRSPRFRERMSELSSLPSQERLQRVRNSSISSYRSYPNSSGLREDRLSIPDDVHGRTDAHQRERPSSLFIHPPIQEYDASRKRLSLGIEIDTVHNLLVEAAERKKACEQKNEEISDTQTTFVDIDAQEKLRVMMSRIQNKKSILSESTNVRFENVDTTLSSTIDDDLLIVEGNVEIQQNVLSVSDSLFIGELDAEQHPTDQSQDLDDDDNDITPSETLLVFSTHDSMTSSTTNTQPDPMIRCEVVHYIAPNPRNRRGHQTLADTAKFLFDELSLSDSIAFGIKDIQDGDSISRDLVVDVCPEARHRIFDDAADVSKIRREERIPMKRRRVEDDEYPELTCTLVSPDHQSLQARSYNRDVIIPENLQRLLQPANTDTDQERQDLILLLRDLLSVANVEEEDRRKIEEILRKDRMTDDDLHFIENTLISKLKQKMGQARRRLSDSAISSQSTDQEQPGAYAPNQRLIESDSVLYQKSKDPNFYHLSPRELRGLSTQYPIRSKDRELHNIIKNIFSILSSVLEKESSSNYSGLLLNKTERETLTKLVNRIPPNETMSIGTQVDISTTDTGIIHEVINNLKSKLDNISSDDTQEVVSLPLTKDELKQVINGIDIVKDRLSEPTSTIDTSNVEDIKLEVERETLSPTDELRKMVDLTKNATNIGLLDQTLASTIVNRLEDIIQNKDSTKPEIALDVQNILMTLNDEIEKAKRLQLVEDTMTTVTPQQITNSYEILRKLRPEILPDISTRLNEMENNIINACLQNITPILNRIPQTTAFPLSFKDRLEIENIKEKLTSATKKRQYVSKTKATSKRKSQILTNAEKHILHRLASTIPTYVSQTVKDIKALESAESELERGMHKAASSGDAVIALSADKAATVKDALERLQRVGDEVRLKEMSEDPTLQQAASILSNIEAGEPVKLTEEQAEAVKSALAVAREDLGGKVDMHEVERAMRAKQIGSEDALMGDVRRLLAEAQSDESGVELGAADLSALTAVVSSAAKELDKAAGTMSADEADNLRSALAAVDVGALSEASLSGQPVRLTPEMGALLQEVVNAGQKSGADVAGAPGAGDDTADSRQGQGKLEVSPALPTATALSAMSSVLDSTDANRDNALTPLECVALKESLDGVSDILADEELSEKLSASDRACLESASAKLRAGAATKRGAELSPDETRALQAARNLVTPKVAEMSDNVSALEESLHDLHQLLEEDRATSPSQRRSDADEEPIVLSSSEVNRLKDVVQRNEEALVSRVMSDPSNEALQAALRSIAATEADKPLSLSSQEVSGLAEALEASKALLEEGKTAPRPGRAKQQGDYEALDLSPLFAVMQECDHLIGESLDFLRSPAEIILLSDDVCDIVVRCREEEPWNSEYFDDIWNVLQRFKEGDISGEEIIMLKQFALMMINLHSNVSAENLNDDVRSSLNAIRSPRFLLSNEGMDVFLSSDIKTTVSCDDTYIYGRNRDVFLDDGEIIDVLKRWRSSDCCVISVIPDPRYDVVGVSKTEEILAEKYSSADSISSIDSWKARQLVSFLTSTLKDRYAQALDEEAIPPDEHLSTSMRSSVSESQLEISKHDVSQIGELSNVDDPIMPCRTLSQDHLVKPTYHNELLGLSLPNISFASSEQPFLKAEQHSPKSHLDYSSLDSFEDLKSIVAVGPVIDIPDHENELVLKEISAWKLVLNLSVPANEISRSPSDEVEEVDETLSADLANKAETGRLDRRPSDELEEVDESLSADLAGSEFVSTTDLNRTPPAPVVSVRNKKDILEGYHSKVRTSSLLSDEFDPKIGLVLSDSEDADTAELLGENLSLCDISESTHPESARLITESLPPRSPPLWTPRSSISAFSAPDARADDTKPTKCVEFGMQSLLEDIMKLDKATETELQLGMFDELIQGYPRPPQRRYDDFDAMSAENPNDRSDAVSQTSPAFGSVDDINQFTLSVPSRRIRSNSLSTNDEATETDDIFQNEFNRFQQRRAEIIDRVGFNFDRSTVWDDLMEAQLSYMIGRTDLMLEALDRSSSDSDSENMHISLDIEINQSLKEKTLLENYRQQLFQSQQDLRRTLDNMKIERSRYMRQVHRRAKSHSARELLLMRRQAQIEMFRLERERELRLRQLVKTPRHNVSGRLDVGLRGLATPIDSDSTRLHRKVRDYIQHLVEIRRSILALSRRQAETADVPSIQPQATMDLGGGNITLDSTSMQIPSNISASPLGSMRWNLHEETERLIRESQSARQQSFQEISKARETLNRRGSPSELSLASGYSSHSRSSISHVPQAFSTAGASYYRDDQSSTMYSSRSLNTTTYPDVMERAIDGEIQAMRHRYSLRRQEREQIRQAGDLESTHRYSRPISHLRCNPDLPRPTSNDADRTRDILWRSRRTVEAARSTLQNLARQIPLVTDEWRSVASLHSNLQPQQDPMPESDF